ncbi:MAG: transcription termination/antitermination factor NusG [Clostridia bacterium]|nr:transcription termination/antitermination factor NusG [Clostridia bacterium]
MSIEEIKTEEPKWYVIHTYSSYETMVKANLEKIIENNNLQNKIFEISIPTEETMEEKANGKKKIFERKKFPCYVFLKMIFTNDLWYLITNIRGVTGFVGPQGRPMPLTADEVMRLGLAKVAVDVDFVVGDEVKVMTGPLESFTGNILALNDQLQKARVNVVMFGRATEVELDYVQIKKTAPAVTVETVQAPVTESVENKTETDAE